MPFDTIAAKKIIHSLQAHRQQPGGELMEQAAVSLADAVNDAIIATGQTRSAEAEVIKTKRLYDDCLLEIKTLRETASLCDDAIKTLQKVAETKKGAAGVAREWLLLVGRMPPSAPEGKA